MDKFRSTATARDLGATIVALEVPGVTFDAVAVSDGGEGFRSSFDGEVVRLMARTAWGHWRYVPLTVISSPSETVGILEVAEIVGRASGLTVTSSMALRASSAGVGDAIVASAGCGVTRLMVGCGGSATSDGGEGCFDVLERYPGRAVRLVAATDVTADFFGALRYCEQKGVAAGDVALVGERLEGLATRYESVSGHDVRATSRTGAAGGLSGALFAAGAQLVSGFDEVARANDLRSRLDAASTVITGEGRFDAGSLEGKVVESVCVLTTERHRVLVVCGSSDPAAVRELTRRYPWAQVRDLVSRFGQRRAVEDTLACVGAVVEDFLRGD